jgi:hypothetical protein
MAMDVVDRLFLAHPRSAGQGYFEHMRFAWRFAADLTGAALAAVVHGAFPCAFERTAGDRVRMLHARLTRRDEFNASADSHGG